MAERLNMEFRSYNNLENDKVKIDFDRIEQIAKLFGIEVMDFMQIENINDLKRFLLESENSKPDTPLINNLQEKNFVENQYAEITNYVNNITKLADAFNEQSQITAKLISEIHKLKIWDGRSKL